MPALLLSMMLFQAAAGDPNGPIVDPQWDDVKVYPGELEKYFPSGARQKGESGGAAVECTVSPKGALEACKVLREIPEGEGFGEAAIKVAARFKMKTVTRSGAAAPGRVIRIPISFNFVWTPQPIEARPSFNITASPKWIRLVDAEFMARNYPPSAASQDKEGETEAHCRILPDGHLSECVLRRETPEGYGFGEATLKIVKVLQLDMRDGAAMHMAGGEINLPIRFRLPRF